MATRAVPFEATKVSVAISGHRYDAIAYPPNMTSQLDDVWALGVRPIAVRDAITPRQSHLLRSMQDAFRSIRDELADRNYSPEHTSSLLTLLALGTSDAVVDLLTTFARWDPRRRVVRGLDRTEWVWRPDFAEVGGSTLSSRLSRRFDAVVDIIRASAHGCTVDVRSDDMRSLGLPHAAFDQVIWDPPYYDNIDYDHVALPFARFLRSLIGELHTDLRWPRAAMEPGPRPRLDVDHYEDSLRRAAAEVVRVLQPGGRLGVFWIAQDEGSAEDLRGFLDLVQPHGLELIQSVALQTDVRLRGPAAASTSPRPVFLVFRHTPSAQPADAVTVLEGALAGRPMMYSGLIDLLMQTLDIDDLEALIPSGYKGSIEERLAEVVMSCPDPRRLLEDVPRKALRAFVKERAGMDDTTGLTKRDLDDRAIVLLGWQLPHAPNFTIGSALDELESLTSKLRLATTETDIRGHATAAFDRIEQILRFTVTTWATFLGSDDWATVVKEIVGRDDRLTFGQWLQAFREVPSRYATESPLIGQIGARVRRSKVVPELEGVVALRNRVAHPEADEIDWNDLRTRVDDALRGAIERLRAADVAGALPQVLQPVEETRDTYDRFRLRLVGHRDQHFEFLMTQSSDLTKPIVVLRGDTNPREVDPTWVSAEVVAERAGHNRRV